MRPTSLPIAKPKRLAKNSIPISSTKELHAHLIRNQLHQDPRWISPVIKSYASSQSHIGIARIAFIQIHRPTLLIWNYMIGGLAVSDKPNEAVDMYRRLKRHGTVGDNLTFISVLKACARVSDAATAANVHACMLKLGFGSYLYVSNALINVYGCCGYVELAQKLFDGMNNRDLVSWNSLICGYSNCNMFGEVLRVFYLMQEANVKADSVTMVKVILACVNLGKTDTTDLMVKFIEDNQIVIDVYLGNSLIDLYGKRGLLDSAKEVFESMSERNIVTWNSMINGYAKAGNLVDARRIFNEMPRRDVISWTTMITGYCKSSLFVDAVNLFTDMMIQGVKPDEVTMASVLSACGNLGALDVGSRIHDYVREQNVKIDLHVANALIDMYCKCGEIHEARRVFHQMKEKDSISWTSLIMGLAVNGGSDSAIQLFSTMLSQGIKPISGTFVGVLLACSHSGLVDKGLHLFESMEKLYGIKPEVKHYGCVVDLLSRSGDLRRAYELIETWPGRSEPVLWRILLSACKIHGDVGMAALVAKKLLKSDASNSGNYILLSNAYAGLDQWDEADRVRKMMTGIYGKKPTGLSTIEESYGKEYNTYSDGVISLLKPGD